MKRGGAILFFNTLDFAIESDGSDVHITEGRLPYVRIDGKLIELQGFPIVTSEVMSGIFKEMSINKEHLTGLSHDSSYEYNNVRFRVHVFKTMVGWSLSLRLIPTKIPNINGLHLPDAVKGFTKIKNGLVLVTGVTGSGKSTTLASIIQNINEEQNKRIITIEDPIEFVYKDEKSLILQRQLGKDFISFDGAIKDAMRQDPDIILVGELRDLDTIKNAVSLAETGHLVFGTLHTKSVPETFDRIIDVFPSEQQKQIRVQISNVIQGIVTQSLIKKTGGGRVPVSEVMVMTAGIKNIISQAGKLSGIEDQMLMNHGKNGSQTFTQSLAFLVKQGLIEMKVALEEAGSQEEQAKLLSFLER